MIKRILLIGGAIAIAAIVYLFVFNRHEEAPMLSGSGSFKVSSSAFADGAAIPVNYARTGIIGGINISLPLTWSDAPAETKSYVVLMVDRHRIADDRVHWAVINIPADITSLPSDASGTDEMPTGSIELDNSFGESGYGGPQPPRGSGSHEYEIAG